MRRANVATAFLAGLAIGIPIYLFPQITSPHLVVRCLVSMVFLGYLPLLVMFVYGPMVWTGWTFWPENGVFEPVPRMFAWLAGAGAIAVLLESAGLMHYQ